MAPGSRGAATMQGRTCTGTPMVTDHGGAGKVRKNHSGAGKVHSSNTYKLSAAASPTRPYPTYLFLGLHAGCVPRHPKGPAGRGADEVPHQEGGGCPWRPEAPSSLRASSSRSFLGCQRYYSKIVLRERLHSSPHKASSTNAFRIPSGIHGESLPPTVSSSLTRNP